jgi:protoporphyrinogen oxidase
MVSESPSPVVILGAGPAGLTAAYESVKRNLNPVVVEKSGQVGGIARTVNYRGYRFDIGGHRFFTHFDTIQRIWEEVLNHDFVTVPRISRIYYKKRFYQYPLSFFNAISNLGAWEGLLILASYVRAKLRPHEKEKNLEQWITNRFGRRLYQTFFKTYTEKVWGISCREIQSDWAAQRIRGLTLKSVLYDAIFRGSKNQLKTLVRQFHYPVAGPGMMWESMRRRVEEAGGQVLLNAEAIRLRHDFHQIQSVSIRHLEQESGLSGERVISSIPLDELVFLLDPLPPPSVQDAARKLSYRAFILVGVILNKATLFPDNWIYVHGPDVKVGRVQNFKNWSPAMVPDANKTSLGMEYFCSEGDGIWSMRDAELLCLAQKEIQILGLGEASSVEDGVVIRQAKAYPIYNNGYRQHVQTIREFLGTLSNLQTIGRNGLHRYNNQDHSMLTAIMAVANILGEKHDLWAVNTEPSYYE